MSKIKMKAPKGAEGGSANIEGHEYSIPKSGILSVISNTHVETLRRHGFTDHAEAEDFDIDECDDKEKLVEFIEERGGDADTSMGMKKLRRLAHEAAADKE